MKPVSIQIQIRDSRGSKEQKPITIRLYADGKSKYLSTIFRIAPNLWDKKRQRTKHDRAINDYLDKLSSKFTEFLAENPHVRDLNYISSKVLVDDENAQGRLTLIRYLENFVANKIEKGDVITKTLFRYKRVLETMRQYLNSTKQFPLLLVSINLEFIHKWDTYIKSNLKYKGKSLEKNTLNKYHSILRTMLLQAFNEGRIPINPYGMFKLKHKQTHKEFLSEDELQLLKSKKANQDKYENVRLIYLFSCFTGLRFEDAQRVKLSDFKQDHKGNQYLSFISNKAHRQQELPLIDDAIEIINEIRSNLANSEEKAAFLLPRISNQKFNSYMKDLAFRYGIDKNLTHHTSRHTYATLMLGRGVPITVLQVLMGHSNIRETMIYTKISPSYILNEIKRAYK